MSLMTCLVSGRAQEVLNVTWPTFHASPPPALTPPASTFLPAFRIALNVFSESNIVALALSQPAFLGLPPEDAVRLQPLVLNRYQIIQNDPVFRSIASALPYCYAEQTPTNGLALVYCPKNLNDKTPCLIFLHGYGGSFLWTQQLLAEAFPDHLIVCPAFGISSAFIPSSYISECLTAVEQKLGCKIVRPTLMGLSAGGFGAVRAFVQSTNEFDRLVVLAAYPPEETLRHFSKNMPVFFLVGANEFYVQSGLFGGYIATLRANGVNPQFKVLPDADHYFMLSQKEATFKTLHNWLDNPAPQ